MWEHLQIELYKVFKRPRTYLSFAAITALIGVIQLGLLVDGKEYADFVMADFANSWRSSRMVVREDSYFRSSAANWT